MPKTTAQEPENCAPLVLEAGIYNQQPFIKVIDFGPGIIEEQVVIIDFGKYEGMSVSEVSKVDPDFYQKLGFMVELERPGYAKDTTFFYMRKAL